MNWTDFHDPDFIPTYNPVFTDTELETEARDLCSDDTACLFDVAATGRLEIGSSALSAKEEQDVVAALAVPSKFTCLQTCSKRKRGTCRLASCVWWSNHAHFRRCMLVCMYMCTSVHTCVRMCMYVCMSVWFMACVQCACVHCSCVYVSLFMCLLLALPQLFVIHHVAKVCVLLMTPASVPMDTVGPHAAYQVHIYHLH